MKRNLKTKIMSLILVVCILSTLTACSVKEEAKVVIRTDLTVVDTVG